MILGLGEPFTALFFANAEYSQFEDAQDRWKTTDIEMAEGAPSSKRRLGLDEVPPTWPLGVDEDEDDKDGDVETDPQMRS